MNTLKKLLLALTCLSLFTACNKDDSQDEELPLRMNQFIQNCLSTFYFWNDQMPNLSPESVNDPNKYFKQLLFKDDKWSLITDDVDGLMAELAGTNETYGYELAGGQFKDSKQCFAIVLYTYPGSPARKFLDRGDAITQINWKNITEDDFPEFDKLGTITLGIAKVQGNTIGPVERIVTLESKVMDSDPVLVSQFFEKGAHKIGYLMYTSFTSNFNSSLEKTFNEFKAKGITDLILDLRYNHGGDDQAAAFLCSAIAPKDKAVKGALLSKERWNTACQQVFENDPQYDELLNRYFIDVNCNLDLPSKKVYILTSHETASASEYTIASLKAFMDVTLVGTRTYGKYFTMYSFAPQYEENGKIVQDKELANWLIFPVCSRFTNINGYPDFSNGLEPDVYVEDDPFNGIGLGWQNEPLLAKAIALISGENPMPIKAQNDIIARGKNTASSFIMLPKTLNDIKDNRVIYMKQ